jgi:hypothetical protein
MMPAYKRSLIVVICVFLLIHATCCWSQPSGFTPDFEVGAATGTERSGSILMAQTTHEDNPRARMRITDKPSGPREQVNADESRLSEPAPSHSPSSDLRRSENTRASRPKRVRVPEIIGRPYETALAILARAGLSAGEIRTIQSPRNSGIVLEQSPPPGTIVVEKSKVNLGISEQMEKPVARILPNPARIFQGRKAVFRSLSSPRGMIRETWKGPGGRQAGGPVFEVDTRSLTPARYEITLVVADKYGRMDETSALLEILPAAEHIATLTADPKRVQTNGMVIFTAAVKPPMEDIRYRFITGEDGGEIPSNLNSVRYSYRTPGEYRAYVVAYPRGGNPVFSRQIVIRVDPEAAAGTHESGAGPVSRDEPPAKDEPQRRVETPAKAQHEREDELPWSSLIFGAIAVSAAAYLLTRKKPGRKDPGKTPQVEIRPHKDSGKQSIEDPLAHTGTELRLRPVFDKGKQEVVLEGGFAPDERRINE